GCGIRVGAIASRNEEIIEHIARFGRLRLSPPMLGQKIALAALSLDRDYHQPVVKEFASRRDLLLSRLSQLPDVIFHAPEGAFYMLVRLPIKDSEHFCAWLLTDFQYQGKTVMLSPGTGFYATLQKGTDEVRIAYILGKERLSSAMDCLEKALQVYSGLEKTVSPAASTQP
ncbi:MAG: aminotransferase class I/II-fold pyridoxal phosphate-dependent enzyme, partial [Saprospiraceae bacterium]|nr:aminotransferase class I/II-fold pyridoxal phosphate-dependent enzyme [Saprospiraceae bacterium]